MRASVRYRLGDAEAAAAGARFSDLVGTVVDGEELLTGGPRPTAITVRGHDGGVTRVPIGRVVAAKAIPATPWRSVDVDAVLRAMLHGRPPVESAPLGDWVLRASGGWTGRANSCLCHGDPGRPIAEAADAIVAYAVAHGIDPWAYVLRGSDEEVALRGLGWVDARAPEDDADVMHTSTDTVTAEPVVEVAIDGRPDDAWYACAYPDGVAGGAPAVLTAGDPIAFASVRIDGRTVAVGRGSVVGRWVGIGELRVEPAYRRRGWGTGVLCGLARWGTQHDARRAYLEVVVSNSGARRAYERLGFAEAFRYGYLRPPRRRAYCLTPTCVTSIRPPRSGLM